jgi:AcrR family transcriptional regulator
MKKEMTTRDRILEAALKIFSMKGYLGATTREIAGEAGVAEVTLFRHFSSKERLFEEVVNRYSFLPALKGLLPELQSRHYRDSLSVIARRFLGIMNERRHLVRIIQGDIHHSEKLRDIFYLFTDEMFRTLASYFKQMQERGVLRSFDAQAAARAFFGMFFSYFYREVCIAKKKIKKADLDKVVDEFIDIFVRGTIRKNGPIRP